VTELGLSVLSLRASNSRRRPAPTGPVVYALTIVRGADRHSIRWAAGAERDLRPDALGLFNTMRKLRASGKKGALLVDQPDRLMPRPAVPLVPRVSSPESASLTRSRKGTSSWPRRSSGSCCQMTAGGNRVNVPR
jgi:hypothetical protein